MGFYIRKSVSVGPLRFNLSKSGIGVSAGVKGLRLGMGPRGNYIHMGRGGLYYRKTIPSSPKSNSYKRYPKQEPITEIDDGLVRIESGNITEMVDSSSEELISEINRKKEKIKWWPIIMIIGLLFSIFFYRELEQRGAVVYLAIFFALLTVIVSIIDKLRKTTVLMFDLESDASDLYKRLHDSFDGIASAAKVWSVEAEGATKDLKRNAGASTLVKRKAITLKAGNPPGIKSNIPIPLIPAGKNTLCFLPDKVLLFTPNGVGGVSYSNMSISSVKVTFVEDGIVPRDAVIIDRTWKYVNKKGGPDKRFKENRELPVVSYEQIDFGSTTGLNLRIQVSKLGAGYNFSAAVLRLADIANH